MSDAPPPEQPLPWDLDAPVELDALEVVGGTPVSVADFTVDQMIHDAARPLVKPKRMTADVWAIAREYAETGGLLDMTEDIASLSEVEQKVRRHSKLHLSDKATIIGQLVERRVRAKKTHMSVQKDLDMVITHDRFMALLEDFTEVLMEHLGDDPQLLRRIGNDIGRVVQRWQVRGA